MDDQVKESEFDTRTADLTILANLLEDKTVYYRKSLNGDVESMKNYMYTLKSIFRHIKYLVDEDSDLETEIKQKLSQAKKAKDNRAIYEQKEEAEIFLNRLEKADDKINELRNKANLSMPTKAQVNPEEAYKQGL